MEKFIVTGGTPLTGTLHVSGAKNAALKALVAACLTDETVSIQNFPLISDLHVMKEIIEILGGQIEIHDHTVSLTMKDMKSEKIPLDMAARIRTSIMFIAPLLVRTGKAIIPNPGGDRIGSRPIDRIINGLKKMNVNISYHEDDGYFYAETSGLTTAEYTFEKNTHTGTETLIMTSVLTPGITILKNAAEEPEVDELIDLLNSMGARIIRSASREITIEGVEKLHGVTVSILPDRNEIVTFAIAAYITKGDITIKKANTVDLSSFLTMLEKTGATFEIHGEDIRFFYTKQLKAVDVTTSIHPGFMTDWQGPWTILMTQAQGVSVIHETVFEYRFAYVTELKKMGAQIETYDISITDPEVTYNFNLQDSKPDHVRAIKVHGPCELHNAVMTICDLRAGATLVLAALTTNQTTVIYGLEQLDRGYEKFEKRLESLGARIERVHE